MQKSISIQFGAKELVLRTGDLLSAPVDVIVNPANGGLSHGGGLAEQILNEAGNDLQLESDALIRQRGLLSSGMAVFTTAGRLPYKAVIHAVGPRMGEGHETDKITQAVTHSLELCTQNNWQTIAFPAISTGIFSVPVDMCARGFKQAISSYWDSSDDKAADKVSPDKIFIYLSENSLNVFSSVFATRENSTINTEEHSSKAIETGHVNLSEEDIADLNNAEMDDWFK